MSPETRPATELELPWAPSVGTYWQPFAVTSGPQCRCCGKRTGDTRSVMTLTQRARMYRSDVAAAIRRQLGGARLQAYRTPVQVDISLRPPDRRKRDLDNFAKGVLDALTHAGVWIDDSQIDQLNIRRGRVLKGGSVQILIAPLDPVAEIPEQVELDFSDELAAEAESPDRPKQTFRAQPRKREAPTIPQA